MTTTPHVRLLLSALLALATAIPTFARVTGRVHALTQATVKIEVTGGPVIYIDPFRMTTTPADADFILITHNHADHQSVADINRVRKASTVFVTSPPGAPALQNAIAGATLHVVTPGQRLTLGGVEIDTVPMYNVSRNNHPRAMNFVGYVLNVGGVRVYHAGDTERIPEMQQFACDVAMLPLGQTFTMTSVDQAVSAALDLQARVAIPIHWGVAEGTQADVDTFATALRTRMQVVTGTGPAGFPLEISETVAFAEHPVSTTVAPGGQATLRVQATGTGALAYQWRRNGVALPGRTAATLPLGPLAATDAGDYSVIVSDANGPLASRLARLTVAAPSAGNITNLSVRGQVRAGAPLIVGCIVEGTKPLLVRGLGPALADFGVAGVLPDPRLDVHAVADGRDTIVASNGDWGADGGATALRPVFASAGAFQLSDPAGRDAALVTPMSGARTLHVADTAGRAGVALLEVYDPAPAATGRLVNLSARNLVGSGEATLIAGFSIGGNVPKRLLIRAVGPRLTAFGVNGVLADPRLELFMSDGRGGQQLFAANENWADGGVTAVREAFAAAGAFDLGETTARDAALVVTVPAGTYTAQVSGTGGATGEALVEVYELR
jgi:L-ascorbate metabolism protein UlaG (beta-lactamase superfamily)